MVGDINKTKLYALWHVNGTILNINEWDDDRYNCKFFITQVKVYYANGSLAAIYTNHDYWNIPCYPGGKTTIYYDSSRSWTVEDEGTSLLNTGASGVIHFYVPNNASGYCCMSQGLL